MNAGGATAGAAAAAAAAVANAVKASGVLVRLEPAELERLLAHAEDALVVYAPARGWLGKHHYLFAWRGLAFYTKSDEVIALHGRDVVTAKAIWVPS